MIEEWNWTKGCKELPSLRALHPWLRHWLTWLIHSCISRWLTKWLIEPVGQRRKPLLPRRDRPEEVGRLLPVWMPSFWSRQQQIFFLTAKKEDVPYWHLLVWLIDRFAWFGIEHRGREGELSPGPLLRHVWERKEWFSLVRKKGRLTLYLFSSSGSKIPWNKKDSLNFKLLWKPYSLLIGCSSFSLIKVSGLVIPTSTLAWSR